MNTKVANNLKAIINLLSKIMLDNLNAISVVQENMNTGVEIRSKVGLFRSALNEEWVANEPHDERTTSQLKDEFSEWFDLAKEQGIVQTSKRTDEGIFVLKPGEGWVL